MTDYLLILLQSPLLQLGESGPFGTHYQRLITMETAVIRILEWNIYIGHLEHRPISKTQKQSVLKLHESNSCIYKTHQVTHLGLK